MWSALLVFLAVILWNIAKGGVKPHSVSQAAKWIAWYVLFRTYDASSHLCVKHNDFIIFLIYVSILMCVACVRAWILLISYRAKRHVIQTETLDKTQEAVVRNCTLYTYLWSLYKPVVNTMLLIHHLSSLYLDEFGTISTWYVNRWSTTFEIKNKWVTCAFIGCFVLFGLFTQINHD